MKYCYYNSEIHFGFLDSQKYKKKMVIKNDISKEINGQYTEVMDNTNRVKFRIIILLRTNS